MDKRYIVINRKDIWLIENESDTYYEIHTRNTWARVNKTEVYIEAWSSLLYYDGANIEIMSSEIEIESEEEYIEWLFMENENINPFRVFDEVGFLSQV